jgi:succinyl-CoA synthetase alpha subunit
VPPPFAADAMMEAAAAGVKFIVCITEGVPVIDMLTRAPVHHRAGRAAARPQLPGRDHAGAGEGRHHPGPHLHARQRRRREPLGTLTYEVVYHLTRAGLGQSTCVGIGGDPINGTGFIDALEAFENDPTRRSSR